MSVALRRSVVLRLSLAGVLALAAGFILAAALGFYRSPLMTYWLDALPLC